MQDVFDIAEAFTKNDPDGNGKNDTYGLGFQKDIWGGLFGAEGIANGFHAYPRTWVKDDNGELVYGSIQPEMKPLFKKLQEFYKDGIIDQEFSVKDAWTVGERLRQGKSESILVQCGIRLLFWLIPLKMIQKPIGSIIQ